MILRSFYTYHFLTFCTLIFFFASCDTQNEAPDIRNVQVDIDFYNFYQDFSAINPENLPADLVDIKDKYPDFADFYLQQLIPMYIEGDYYTAISNYKEKFSALYSFLTYKDYRDLFDTVNIAFPNTEKYNEIIANTFRYIQYYDSSITLPQHIYYFVSGLNHYTVALIDEKSMGVGLDMFLGKNFSPYASVGIPDYALQRFTAENIPVWVARVIYDDRYPFYPEGKNLLEMMIERGKEMYFLEKVTPFVHDSVRLGFTSEQFQWSKNNEAMAYNFLVQQGLLYETNLQKIYRYVLDGPTATGMPAESPGNIGSYIGLSIVKSYAKNTNTDLQTLMQEKDARKILELARYKP